MPLVQPILVALSAALQEGHENEAQEVLTALVQVAQDLVSRFVFPKVERAGVVKDTVEKVKRSEPHMHSIASLKSSPSRVLDRMCCTTLNTETLCSGIQSAKHTEGSRLPCHPAGKSQN
jgi:hypothetical protein